MLDFQIKNSCIIVASSFFIKKIGDNHVKYSGPLKLVKGRE